jgi:hypothetical protein
MRFIMGLAPMLNYWLQESKIMIFDSKIEHFHSLFRDCESVHVGEALASLFGAKAPPTLYKNNDLQNSKIVL